MRVVATRMGDVALPGGTVKAVFPGQEYDLPDDAALPGITDGWLKKAEAPASDKAEEPVSDKAVRAPRGNKREQA
jgi:hypothetical protein